jgi:hypothetical protein
MPIVRQSPFRAITYTFVALLLILSVVPFSQHAAAASPTPGTGLIIPLYSPPGSTWYSVIQAKTAYPYVPMVVIIDISNGPGASANSNYASWIGKLQSAGILVVGYVYTEFGARSIASAESDMSSYQKWYHLNGIFFDQMSAQESADYYYSQLESYANSLGLPFTIGNAGMAVPSSEVGLFHLTIIYEGAGTPNSNFLSLETSGHNRNDFAMIAYDSQFSSSYIQDASGYVGYLYLTNDGMPDPYDTIPSYFTSVVSELSTSETTTITVQSLGTNNTSLNGMRVTVDSGGSAVESGFTPLTFTAILGQQYSVQVSSYGNEIFQHWDDGLANQTRTFDVTEKRTLTAFYGPPPKKLIDVQAITATGAPLPGMRAIIESNGSTVASGFTPFSYYGNPGTEYTVTVSNYADYEFSYWNNWSPSHALAFTLQDNSSLTAIFNGCPCGISSNQIHGSPSPVAM